MSSLSYSPPPCSCPTRSTVQTTTQQQQISPTLEDIEWVKSQIEVNGLHMQDNVLRKSINPRTSAQQLQDLI
ncbi:hypothetical protein Hanom_Chr15g01404511 [Helianthus anomalus]